MNKTLQKFIRKFCNLSGKPYRIEVVPGNEPPKLAGRGFYWTTPSGKTVVHHPNAYRWPKLYHASTRRIEVGERWVKKEVRRRLSLSRKEFLKWEAATL